MGIGVTFTGMAFDPSPADQGSLVYVWEFGDGTQGTGSVASHTYAQAGTYNVKLTVTDKDGGRGTATTTAQVGQTNRPPQAIITGPNNGQVGETLQFSGAKSSDSDGNIIGYTWNFGDDTTANGVNVNHAYAAAGTYQVTLTVKDNGGLTHNTALQVKIEKPAPANQPPQAVINGPEKGLVGETLTFRGGQSTDSDGQIVAYTWDLGDGTGSNEPKVEHVYQQAGDYTLTLTVTDDGGLTNRTQHIVKIEQPAPANLPPTAVISGTTTAAVGETVTFRGGASSDEDGQIVSYLWDLGDGTAVDTVEATHVYTAPGQYTISLTVTDDGGLTANAGTILTVTDGSTAGNISPGHEVRPK
jgi:PKD repeat protein